VATLTIGRLADEAGVSVDTVRFYERKGLLPEPARTAGGYRSYTADDAWRLRFILRAKDLGFTLREIAELLAGPLDGAGGADAVQAAAAAKLEALAAQQAELAVVRGRLLRLVELCEEGDEGCASLQLGCGA
jgi:MerR family copper efflux transcriptional regulator